MGVNKVILVGRLGTDPELTTTRSDRKVCKFNIATSENWKDSNGEKKEKTTWHRIIIWGRLGEVCAEHLEKGREVYVEGKIDNRTWEDDKGVKKYISEVVAKDVQFLGGRGDSRDSRGSQNRSSGRSQRESRGSRPSSNDRGGGPNNGNRGWSEDEIPF
jgi:single-strand DNA-binding protein